MPDGSLNESAGHLQKRTSTLPLIHILNTTAPYSGFQMNGHKLGDNPQTQKSEPPFAA